MFVRILILLLIVLGVEVRAGVGQTNTASAQQRDWSFRNHVQPVLAKNGCSAGACHGAAAGQGGFSLSLRGYDNEGDFIALTRHALGRRIDLHDPARSLILLKGTGAVPHKGGKRFDTNSIDYRVLSQWIAAGAPGLQEDEPRIEKIEIEPRNITLALSEAHQLSVRATFSDGHTEDVTRWAKYTSANGAVVQTDEGGRVKVIGSGEGAVTAWYLSRIAIATVTSPYTNDIPPEVFAQAKTRNFIDQHVNEKLKALNLPPSPKSSDETFIRRAHLDTIGVLPTADEVRTFVSDSSESKRDRLIEALLQRPEYVDYWTYKWSDLLLVSSKKLKPQSMWSYYNWIRDHVSADTAWDKMIAELVTAQGSALENGAANYYVLREDPRDMAEMTSQAFLGMSINCAKCHNHPMEKWTNDQYYQMANLFARVRVKNGPNNDEKIIFASHTGDLVQPLRGKPQPPAPLDGEALEFADPADRREPLADWLTSPKNPYFTRAIVNRVWANFLGVGLVEAVDDIRVTNPASNEELFDAAGAFLVENQYDLKALMRAILQSETYQRSSEALPGNAGDDRFYARYYSKRLTAETLLDAVSQATGSATKFAGFPAGWRATQLPDPSIDSYFLKTFGRPERNVVCECERTDEPTVTQVLHLANGDTVNEKLTAKGNRIDKLISSKRPASEVVDELFLNALSRHPAPAEKEKLLAALENAKPEEQRLVLEDILWATLSSKEFLFNH